MDKDPYLSTIKPAATEPHYWWLLVGIRSEKPTCPFALPQYYSSNNGALLLFIGLCLSQPKFERLYYV